MCGPLFLLSFPCKVLCSVVGAPQGSFCKPTPVCESLEARVYLIVWTLFRGISISFAHENKASSSLLCHNTKIPFVWTRRHGHKHTLKLCSHVLLWGPSEYYYLDVNNSSDVNIFIELLKWFQLWFYEQFQLRDVIVTIVQETKM